MLLNHAEGFQYINWFSCVRRIPQKTAHPIAHDCKSQKISHDNPAVSLLLPKHSFYNYRKATHSDTSSQVLP